MSLTTLAQVKTYLNITGTSQDVIIAALISPVEEMLKAYINVQEATSYTDCVVVQRDKCSYHYYVTLDRGQIQSITTLAEPDGTSISEAVQVIDNRRLSFGYSPDNVRCGQHILVQYSAGFDTGAVPDDIQYCIALLIQSSITAQSGAGGQLESYSLGSKSVNFDTSTNEYKAAKSILDMYAGKYQTANIISC